MPLQKNFRLSHNEILYKHKHTFFQNILAGSPLGEISLISLLQQISKKESALK